MSVAQPPIRTPWSPDLDVARRRLWHHLAVAARVNVSTVVPLVLLLLIFSERPTWAGLARATGVALVFTNCSFVVLNAFYHLVWERLARPQTWKYVLLGLVILPALGALAFAGGWFLMDLLAPGLLEGRGFALMSTTIVISVLYGLGFFSIEDQRRRQHSAEGALEQSRVRENQLVRAQKESEIVALQALMKPHFVFNTLNAITALIHDDPGKAEETTIRLAQLLRHILEMGADTMMSLDAEVKVATAYLEIERVRMGRRLEFAFDVPRELGHIPVPGLLLQPLVENAVKHGVRQRPDEGYVRMRAWADGAHCLAEIADNGPGFSQHQGSGCSMRLLRERLDRIYGRDYELTLARDHNAGETVASLRFPMVPPREPAR
jgi:signal transduction histidine kinase